MWKTRLMPKHLQTEIRTTFDQELNGRHSSEGGPLFQKQKFAGAHKMGEWERNERRKMQKKCLL